MFKCHANKSDISNFAMSGILISALLPRPFRVSIACRHRRLGLALFPLLLVLVLCASSFLAEGLGFEFVPVPFDVFQSRWAISKVKHGEIGGTYSTAC